jgi:adenylosuccinate lyase
MEELWSEQNKFANFLEIELASLQALSTLGIIPKSDFIKIKSNAHFDVHTIKELEITTKHDVISFTRVVSKSLGEEKKWFHYGLTSTDIVDSSNSLNLRKVNAILEQDILGLLEVLKKKAKMYQFTPCIGRTHGMHAEVTSFGLKWVLWYDELNRNLSHFKLSRTEIEVIKMSGAVGSFSTLPVEVESMAAEVLGLGYAKISTQVLSRDRHANYIFSLAQIASTIEKIATEIRHLSRTEVKEVSEYFESGQKGSSAMPHKKNPIASENMCGCARMMKSYVNVALENNTLWHERDISHSSAERIILADASTLLDYMLKRYTEVLDKLVVNEKQMFKNISLTNNVIFSGRVLSALINKGISREESYDLIQPLAFTANEEDIDFRVLLKDSPVNKLLTNEEINECFNVDYYLRNVEKIYERVGL